jgi:uncharacterized protein (DUF305 family)
MEKNTGVVIAIGMLVVGLAAGYSFGAHNTRSIMRGGSSDMMHRMPDGSMMETKKMGMDEMMHAMNAELEGKTGSDFDKAFLSEMIVHHEGAVEMAELALTNAKQQELKDLAEAIITAQKGEITQMKAWQKEWFAN